MELNSIYVRNYKYGVSDDLGLSLTTLVYVYLYTTTQAL